MRQHLSVLLIAVIVVLTLSDARAASDGAYEQRRQRSGGTQPEAYFVPWKVVKAGDPPLTTPVILYWFASSAEDVHGGDLSMSRTLVMDSALCVGMQLVPPDDKATLDKFEVTGKLPRAILASDGKVVAHVDADKGHLMLSDVENMIHHELYERETVLDAQLAEAQKKAGAGDREGAVALYQKVWAQHCLAPKQGKEAQKALRKLGITVNF